MRSGNREKDRIRERKKEKKKDREIASENEKALKIWYEQNHERFIVHNTDG